MKNRLNSGSGSTGKIFPNRTFLEFSRILLNFHDFPDFLQPLSLDADRMGSGSSLRACEIRCFWKNERQPGKCGAISFTPGDCVLYYDLNALRPQVSSSLKSMAHGPWPMAHGPWPMAYGLWPMAYGLWAYGLWAHGPRPTAHGPRPAAHGPWPMAYGITRGLWPMAYGLLPMAYFIEMSSSLWPMAYR